MGFWHSPPLLFASLVEGLAKPVYERGFLATNTRRFDDSLVPGIDPLFELGSSVGIVRSDRSAETRKRSNISKDFADRIVERLA